MNLATTPQSTAPEDCRSLTCSAHPRSAGAHCPPPATAPGAAQACPECLPCGFNQRTRHGDLLPDRRIERAVRSASVPSQIGDGTRDDRRFPAKSDWSHFATRALARIFRPFAPSLPASAGSPQHTVRCGQIGSPVGTMNARAAHLQKAPPSLPASLQISGVTSGHPALSDLPTSAWAALIDGHVSGGQGLRPLAPPSTAAAINQLNFSRPAGPGRPFLGFSLGRSVRLRTQRIGSLYFRSAEHTLLTFARGSLNRDRCSGWRALQVLGPLAIAAVPIKPTLPKQSGPSRPFLPSSPSLKPGLRSKRNGGGIHFDFSPGALGNEFRDSLKDLSRQTGLPTLAVVFPVPDDREHKHFPRGKVRGGSLSLIFPLFLRGSGPLRRDSAFLQKPHQPQRPNVCHATKNLEPSASTSISVLKHTHASRR